MPEARGYTAPAFCQRPPHWAGRNLVADRRHSETRGFFVFNIAEESKAPVVPGETGSGVYVITPEGLLGPREVSTPADEGVLEEGRDEQDV
jgi:hypothetical protein